MNVPMRLAILLMLTVSIATLSGSISLAGQEHQSQHNRPRSKPMSNRPSDSSNARWLADPTRGWIRGDDSHDTIDEKDSINSSTGNRGKAKAGPRSKKTP